MKRLNNLLLTASIIGLVGCSSYSMNLKGDINEDGRKEIVNIKARKGEWRRIYENGAVRFRREYVINVYSRDKCGRQKTLEIDWHSEKPSNASLEDLNGDGNLDLVIQFNNPTFLGYCKAIYFGNDGGTFEKCLHIPNCD